MPTPKQLHAMQEFYSRPDFVVNEIIELPSSDDEDTEEDKNYVQATEKCQSLDEDDDFEPQNEEERQWKREDTERKTTQLSERKSEHEENCLISDEEHEWRQFQKKVIQATKADK